MKAALQLTSLLLVLINWQEFLLTPPTRERERERDYCSSRVYCTMTPGLSSQVLLYWAFQLPWIPGVVTLHWIPVFCVVSCHLRGPQFFRILPNKHACLNKHAPEFTIWAAISQLDFTRSQSHFQHLRRRYSAVQHVNLKGIRQVYAFILCPRALHVFWQNMVYLVCETDLS